MTSHHITIAKAAFAAACLRPDARQLTREDLSRFHELFETAVSRCIPSYVQTCKTWLLDNIIPSPHRIAALGKYLISYSKTVIPEDTQTNGSGADTTNARRRLHVLYILNDLLHHLKYHGSYSSRNSFLEDGLQSYITDLFHLARQGEKTRVIRRIGELIDIWEVEQYFGKQTISRIKRAVSDPEPSNPAAASVTEPAAIVKDTPFTLPSTHGDPTLPYYDLPAANLMPHMVPNKSIPMRPDQIKALQLSAGPADESLVNAVKDFLKEVDRMENPYQSLEDESIVANMDELGQLSFRDEADEIKGDTYYGWSRDFCSKMKKRSPEGVEAGRRSRSRSYSRSHSSSLSRSRSRSRSRSPPKRRRYEDSRSRSPQRRQRYRSQSTSQSPDRKPAATRQNQPAHFPRNAAYSFPTFTGSNIPYPPLPLSTNGLPIPPPRPPNYRGPWPPPPPPPMPFGSQNTQFSSNASHYPAYQTSPSFNHQNNRP